MRFLWLCLSFCVLLGCSGSNSGAPAPTAPVVTNETLKELLKTFEHSGYVGSGMEQVRIGVEASGKPELKTEMSELMKADQAGNKPKVKLLATKMLKSL